MSLAMGLLYLLEFYALAGLCTAFLFVIFGVTRVMPGSFTIGARILIWPGAFALWPYVLYRWLTSGRQ